MILVKGIDGTEKHEEKCFYIFFPFNTVHGYNRVGQCYVIYEFNILCP